MEVKTCTKCGKSYPATTEFFYCKAGRRQGLDTWCRDCEAAYNHAYRVAHQEELTAKSRAYNASHKEKKATYRQAWRQRNRERINKHHREYQRQRLQADPMLRLTRSISARIRRSLGDGKAGRPWESLVGYVLEDFRHYFEARFHPGMNWLNYGRGGWVIDHIRPISSFHFETPDDPDFKACWALENLQPMWWSDNQRKSARESALLATDQRGRRRRK